MKLDTIEVPYKNKSTKIKLIPVGDVHLGNICCDVDSFSDTMKYITRSKNMFTLLMGDLADSIVHSDNKRYDLDTIDPDYATPEMQINGLMDILEPAAKRGKIIGLLEGNHEHGLKKRSYIPVCERLSKELNVPFLGYQTMIRFIMRRGKHTCTKMIYAHHGHGGGRRVGSKINKLIEFSNHWDADVYLMGHVHTKGVHQTERLYVPKRGELQLRAKKRVFGLTGTFLKTNTMDTASTYSERAGYSPTSIGTIRVEFLPEKGGVNIIG